MKSKYIEITFGGIKMKCQADIADGTVFEVCAVEISGNDIIELLSGEVLLHIEQACREVLEKTRTDEAIYPGEDAP